MSKTKIKAEIHTDGYEEQTWFDAEPWFEQASDAEIKALSDIGWRGDYPADDVAWWMQARDAEVNLVLMVVEEDQLGFEVVVDPEDAERWVKKNRPGLLDKASNPGNQRKLKNKLLR